MHKPLLDMAGKYPILANVNHHIVGRHFPTSTRMSVLGAQNRQAGPDVCLKNFFPSDVEDAATAPTTP
jgi:hypothetical protein